MGQSKIIKLKPIKNDTVFIQPMFSVFDTLSKYKSLNNHQTKFYQYYFNKYYQKKDSVSCYVLNSTINDQFVGVIIDLDFKVKLYQLIDNNWTFVDSSDLNSDIDLHIETEDLNGDRLSDLNLKGRYGVESLDYTNKAFLFNKERKKFYFNEDFTLPNISLDYEHKFIKSFLTDKEGKVIQKWKYILVANKPTFYEGVRIFYSANKRSHTKIEYFKYEQNVEKVIHTYTGNLLTMRQQFHSLLWTSADIK